MTNPGGQGQPCLQLERAAVVQNLYYDPNTWRVWWLDNKDVLHWVVRPDVLRQWFGNATPERRAILNVRAIGANIETETGPAASVTKDWSYRGPTPGGGRLLRGNGTYHVWWLDPQPHPGLAGAIHWITSPTVLIRYWGAAPKIEQVPLHTLDFYVVAPNVDGAATAQPSPGGNQVTLQAYAGYYWVAEGGGGGAVNVNQRVATAWETFTLVPVGGNRVALKTSNGRYVSAEGGGGGKVNAAARSIGPYEQFTQEPSFSGKFSFRTASGYYLWAENGGGKDLNATKTAAARSDERSFRLTRV
jgi:hypothetical protein